MSSARVVIDSSGWIEVFTNGGQAEHFLATARDHQARLHTMDSDFRGIADVEWVESSV